MQLKQIRLISQKQYISTSVINLQSFMKEIQGMYIYFILFAEL